MIVVLQIEDDALAARSVPGATVAVKRHLVFTVEHDPRVDVLVVLAQDVRHEEVGAVEAADEMRGVLVESTADVADDLVEGDGCVLQHGPKFHAADDGESDSLWRAGHLSSWARWALHP